MATAQRYQLVRDMVQWTIVSSDLPPHKFVRRQRNVRMQLPRSGLAIIGLVSFISFSNASEPATERSDWKKHFDDVSAIGTIIVVDERASSKHTFVYNANRAKVRYSPASPGECSG